MKFPFAKLQLVNHRLVNIHLESNEMAVEEQEKETYDFDFDYDIYKAEEDKLFKIPLTVSFKASEGCDSCRLKYLSIKLEGIFYLPDDTEQEEIDRFVPLNCLALLYSLARGIINNLTANNPGGPLVLPMVDFSKAIDEKSRVLPQKRKRFVRRKSTP